MTIITEEEYEVVQKHPHRLRITTFRGKVLFDAILPLREAFPKIKQVLEESRITKHYSISLMPE